MTHLDTWNQLQANGLKAYREIPEASCALASRRDTKQFKRFIGRQRGLTLDIGCGIKVPGYLDKHNLKNTAGIDPLPAAVDCLPMVRFQGRGEDLPFLEGFFNLVIRAGTIDHVLDPAKVRAEARRVVSPNGRIGVQIGIPGSQPPQGIIGYLRGVLCAFVPPDGLPDRVQKCISTMPVPAGCPDPFHFKYYTEAEIEQLFEVAQLRIARRKRLPGSTFYELKK